MHAFRTTCFSVFVFYLKSLHAFKTTCCSGFIIYLCWMHSFRTTCSSVSILYLRRMHASKTTCPGVFVLNLRRMHALKTTCSSAPNLYLRRMHAFRTCGCVWLRLHRAARQLRAKSPKMHAKVEAQEWVASLAGVWIVAVLQSVQRHACTSVCDCASACMHAACMHACVCACVGFCCCWGLFGAAARARACMHARCGVHRKPQRELKGADGAACVWGFFCRPKCAPTCSGDSLVPGEAAASLPTTERT